MSKSITKNTLRACLGGVAVAGLLATTVAGVANAATPAADQQPQTATEAAVQYLESTGLSSKDAADRVAKQPALSAAAQRLDAVLGSAGGGAFIDQASGELAVGVTDPAMVPAARINGAGKVLVVNRSAAQLEQVRSALTPLLGEVAGASWGIDPSRNAVVVDLPAASPVPAAVDQALGRYGSAVTLTRSEGTAMTTAGAVDAYGGQEYGLPVEGRPGYWQVCSLGFAAVDSAGNSFDVTAGHCTTKLGAKPTLRPIEAKGTTILGTYEKSNFPGNDYGLIRTDTANVTLQAQVDRQNGSYVNVTGSTETAIGGTACKSGRTTKWTCGTIQAKNQTVNYTRADGTGTDRVTGLTKYNACVEGGDSGGAIITGTQAQGLTSGGQGYSQGPNKPTVCGDKVGQPNVAYFQPVNPALSASGLTLVTKYSVQPIHGGPVGRMRPTGHPGFLPGVGIGQPPWLSVILDRLGR